MAAAVKRVREQGFAPRIIMGDDEAAPQDLTNNLIVQLGTVTEELNRSWYERNTGHAVKDVQRQFCTPLAAGLLWLVHIIGNYYV